jgi:hypothetical protein
MKIPLHILKTWQKKKDFPIKGLSIYICGIALNPIEIYTYNGNNDRS